jgi:hypothetical protein
MEGVHKEITQFGALDDGFASHQMSARTDCDAATVLVFDALAAFDQFSEVGEATCAVCVCEDNVLASDMSHAMCDGSTLSSIFLEGDNANAPVGYM